MNLKSVADFLKKNKQPDFRLKQIAKAVYQDGVSSFGEITSLPKELRHQMSKWEILSFEVEKVLEAEPARNATHSVAGGDKESAKAALRLEDGSIIETVLISPKPGMYSVCISTQVGCPMNCGFCATGKGGFKRNLTAEEITDQVLFWKQYLSKSQIQNTKYQINTKSKIKNPKIGNWKLEIGNYNISNVVYMGMGEPFLNWEAVKESLEDLINPEKFGFGSRSISVSTAGIPEGIINFAQTFPQMNLALSLHFADDQKRSEFMPVNKKYNLEIIKKALQDYFKITNRKVFVEYIMLEGINDGLEDAEKLAQYLRSIGSAHLLHVNLIRYNSSTVIASEVKQSYDNMASELKNEIAAVASLPRNDMFQPSSRNKTQAFKNYLLRNKINATIRKSLGEEIQGACGQLAGR